MLLIVLPSLTAIKETFLFPTVQAERIISGEPVTCSEGAHSFSAEPMDGFVNFYLDGMIHCSVDKSEFETIFANLQKDQSEVLDSPL